MPNAENEAVPSNPVRVSGVMPENFLEKKVGDWS
jgi:hypothetical protein